MYKPKRLLTSLLCLQNDFCHFCFFLISGFWFHNLQQLFWRSGLLSQLSLRGCTAPLPDGCWRRYRQLYVCSAQQGKQVHGCWSWTVNWDLWRSKKMQNWKNWSCQVFFKLPSKILFIWSVEQSLIRRTILSAKTKQIIERNATSSNSISWNELNKNCQLKHFAPGIVN